jgi:hypothetical protein
VTNMPTFTRDEIFGITLDDHDRAELEAHRDGIGHVAEDLVVANHVPQSATRGDAVTLFEPRQVRTWSTRELDALVGKQVAVNVSGRETEGRVFDVGIDRSGLPWIGYYPDGTYCVWWNRDTDEVTIHIRPDPR